MSTKGKFNDARIRICQKIGHPQPHPPLNGKSKSLTNNYNLQSLLRKKYYVEILKVWVTTTAAKMCILLQKNKTNTNCVINLNVRVITITSYDTPIYLIDYVNMHTISLCVIHKKC